jgi:hypothetical protein
MMVKSAQPGEGGVCVHALSLFVFTITSKVVVYAPVERPDTLPPYVLCGLHNFWRTVVQIKEKR